MTRKAKAPLEGAVEAALRMGNMQITLHLLERTALHARNYAQVRFSEEPAAQLNPLLDLAQADAVAFELAMDGLASRMNAAGANVVRHSSTFRSREYQADRSRFQRRFASAQLLMDEAAGHPVTRGPARKAEIEKIRKRFGDELRARLDEARNGGRIKQLDRTRIHKEFWGEVEERVRSRLGRHAGDSSGQEDSDE